MIFDYVAIGRRVRNVRKRKGITQSDLAEMVDKSTAHISYIETGAKTMSLETFVAIANALNVSADELLSDVLENTIKVSNHAFTEMLSDCTDYETRVLIDVLNTLKISIRENRRYMKNRR